MSVVMMWNERKVSSPVIRTHNSNKQEIKRNFLLRFTFSHTAIVSKATTFGCQISSRRVAYSIQLGKHTGR